MTAVSNPQWLLEGNIAQNVLFNLLQLAEGKSNPELNALAEIDQPVPVCYLDESSSEYFDLSEAPDGITAVIPLKGTMLKYGTYYHYGTTEIAQMILEAAGSDKVVAIVIDADSGGGQVSSIAPIHYAIKYAQSLGKPVVASADISASANIYAIAACDAIIANNNISSSFGSIGVMVSFFDMNPYYEKLGMKYHEIYPDESSEKNQIWQKAKNDDYEAIKKDFLSPLAIKFQDDMKVFRAGKLNLDRPDILKGIMLSADEAMAEGLIDIVGDQKTALNHALELVQVNKFLSNR